MISAICPLRYNPDRMYFGKTRPFLNVSIAIDCVLWHEIVEQVIVVNHTPEYISCEDPQIDFIKERYRKDPRVVVIDLRHGDYKFNQSWLLNIGIRRATGRYFMRFDIDNIVEPRFSDVFRSMKDVIDNGGILHQDLHGRYEDFINWFDFKYPNSFDDVIAKMRTVRNYGDTSPIICRMDLIQAIKGYDERMQVFGSQDNDVNLRLKMIGCHHIRGLKVLHQPHTHKKKLMKKHEQHLVIVARGLFKLAEQNNIAVANVGKWGVLERPMTSVPANQMSMLMKLGHKYLDSCLLPPTMMR